jgi:hypothetical protein
MPSRPATGQEIILAAAVGIVAAVRDGYRIVAGVWAMGWRRLLENRWR